MKDLVDPYTRAMFGAHAIHVPINLILQPTGMPGKVAGVFQSQMPGLHPMLFGQPDAGHLLILGDCVIRPRIVSTSRHLSGAGIGGIYRDGFDMDTWVRQGKVVLEP